MTKNAQKRLFAWTLTICIYKWNRQWTEKEFGHTTLILLAPCLYIERETLVSQEETTQGEPLAMAMYGIAVIPLIHRLTKEPVQQVWFADDTAAGAQLTPL